MGLVQIPVHEPQTDLLSGAITFLGFAFAKAGKSRVLSKWSNKLLWLRLKNISAGVCPEGRLR